MTPVIRQMAVTLIDEACNAGARLAPACKILGLPCRTIRRWKMQQVKQGEFQDLRKVSAALRTPANKLTEEEQKQILEIANSPENSSLPPSQIVPKLADRGVYVASESSFYRVLRVHNQVNRRGRAQPARIVPKPKGFKAVAPNEVWSWDITYLASTIRGQFYRLYLVEDIYSRKIVGWEVHMEESAEHASTLIKKACLANEINRPGLVLHSDNGSPMKGSTMLGTLQRLGVVPSFSRPSVSNDNPFSESLFRTLKYCPAYPSKPFASLEIAQQWVQQFVTWYNHEHRHSGIKFVTPAQRHAQMDTSLLNKRDALYQTAKASNPSRWSGKTRDWNPVTGVWLNPPKEHINKSLDSKMAA